MLVHGFMGGGAQWHLQRPLGQARPLVALDLPGFGANAHLPPLDRIGAFGAWALDELARRGVEEFDLLGHSMGGMVAQEMVRRAPSRVGALVLYATGAAGVLPGRFESIETSMERARRDGPEATARRIAATWFVRGGEAPEYPACAALAARTGLPAMLAGLEAMRDWTGAEALGDIRARTLVLWGDRDRTYAWPQIETLWKTIPDSSLAVVPGCAHAVHLESPALFDALAGSFLASSS